jgi:hypothetical protein
VAESSLMDVDKWTIVFRLNQTTLHATATQLVCCGCVEDILELAEHQATSFVVPDAFKYRVALRALVKVCLAHVSKCNEMKALERDVEIEYHLQQIRALPVPERFIYVLRDNLKYQRRDVSLLVGMSDEAADRLLEIARSRLARIPIAGPLNSGNGYILS